MKTNEMKDESMKNTDLQNNVSIRAQEGAQNPIERRAQEGAQNPIERRAQEGAQNPIEQRAQEGAEESMQTKLQENVAKKQIYSGIGGQAVIEGMMMRNGKRYSIGVRRPDGSIAVMEDRFTSMTDQHPWLKLPFIRGIFSFVDSMVLGMRCLTCSAAFLEDDPEDAEKEPTKLEAWLDRIFGDKLEPVLETIVMIFSFVVAMLLFVIFPTWIAGFLKPLLPHESLLGLIEGLIRVLLFILYIKMISRTPDIARTFQYHGAEHKCINCVEHGLPLTVDNVAASSKEHKRCGTSFIVYVMLISILLFMVIRVDTLWLRLLSRIVLIPVIAGISFEVLRLVGTVDNALTRILFIPGMWMQGLTTREPDRDEIEVAIAAVERVFDWRSFEKESFGLDFSELPSDVHSPIVDVPIVDGKPVLE